MKDSHKSKRERLETVFRLNPTWGATRISRSANVSLSMTRRTLKGRLNPKREMLQLTQDSIQQIIDLVAVTPALTFEHISKETGYSAFRLRKIIAQLGIAKARPPRPRNMELRERIVVLKHENPLRTLASIGHEVGITRERVRQILNEQGLQYVYPAKKIVSQRSGRHTTCVICNVDIPSQEASHRKTGYCSNCSELKRVEDYNNRRINLICEACDKPFSMLKSAYHWRVERKREYMERVNRVVEETPVACSYTCSATLREFGVRVGKANTKLTPEIRQHIIELRKQEISISDIVKSVSTNFKTRLGNTTISRWIKDGQL